MSSGSRQVGVYECVTRALAEVVGERDFNDQSFLKKDLGLTSIDIIDFLFEVERLMKRRVDARQLFMALSSGGVEGRDLKVGDVVKFLEG